MDSQAREVQRNWEQMGQSEPYWSVVTSPDYKSNQITEEGKRRFYESGQDEVRTMMDFFKRADLPLPQGLCVDYGAGAGRVSIHLAKHFERVIAADMSRAHLAVAEENAKRLGHSLNLLPVSPDGAELGKWAGQVALVHSIIALQHSRPPVIKDVLRLFALILRRGGVAFFQVPTFHPAYDFETAVLGGRPFDSTMELHAVRQREVFAIMAEGGCIPVGVFDYDRVTASWDNRYFMFQKV